MNHRFSEASTDLLDYIACLDQKNGFSNFDMDKLAHLADLYPVDFTSTGRTFLSQELQSFLSDMRIDGRFFNVEDLGSLSKKMKETVKDRVFPMVYRLAEFVTPSIPVRPDWRIRTGFGVQYHILGLLTFFFFLLTLYLWYTNNFCNNQQSFTFKNELPPEWYPLKFIHIY